MSSLRFTDLKLMLGDGAKCHGLLCRRIRRDLESGTLIPAGDMWPCFLFRNFEYNPEDPWEGLLRSSLLVKVRTDSINSFQVLITRRHTNTFLRPQAQSPRVLAKPRDLPMLDFMVCKV